MKVAIIYIHSWVLTWLKDLIVFMLVRSTCAEFQRLMPYIGRDMAVTFKVTQRLTNWFLRRVITDTSFFSQNAVVY